MSGSVGGLNKEISYRIYTGAQVGISDITSIEVIPDLAPNPSVQPARNFESFQRSKTCQITIKERTIRHIKLNEDEIAVLSEAIRAQSVRRYGRGDLDRDVKINRRAVESVIAKINNLISISASSGKASVIKRPESAKRGSGLAGNKSSQLSSDLPLAENGEDNLLSGNSEEDLIVEDCCSDN